MREIVILGSTGSIGRQTLEVLTHLGMSAAALTGNRNTALLEEQARKWKPRLVAAYNEKAAAQLRIALKDTGIRVVSGEEGLIEAAVLPGADTVLTGVMGMVGLKPTLAAVGLGKKIALANKETLVCAGELVMARAAETGARILPVDSEHSAIFQCLEGNSKQEVSRLILTASGGPFFGKTRGELENVTPEQALRHPNWSMGAKITVDSATLMNKGLELIEAMHLFAMEPDRIEVVIHRESIIHSMVEYRDGAVLAQLGLPDMRLPIQYALTWPERLNSPVKAPEFLDMHPLTFAKPDLETFGCLPLARKAAKAKGTSCAVLNAANEVAVERYLRGKIGFLEIEDCVRRAIDTLPNKASPNLEDILAADAEARAIARGDCAI